MSIILGDVSLSMGYFNRLLVVAGILLLGGSVHAWEQPEFFPLPAFGTESINASGPEPAPKPEVATEPEPLPEALKPYSPLIEKCRKWQSRDRGLGWTPMYTEDFEKDPDRWNLISRYASTQKTDGKTELAINSPTGGTIFLPIGPKVKGEFAIEMVARADGAKAVPLGIMLGNDRGQGPGFQFATRRTGSPHFIWTDTVRYMQGARFGPKSLGNEPKLVMKQNHRVRIEVRRNHITALVDGKKVGRVGLSEAYDWTKERQPHAMTVVSSIVVSSFKIERYAPKMNQDRAALDAKTWKTIFGDTTRQQVEVQAAELVAKLDHNAWAVRERAAQMIPELGVLAVPALREAAKSESLELSHRAEQLLKRIAPPPPPPPPPPRTRSRPRTMLNRPPRARPGL